MAAIVSAFAPAVAGTDASSSQGNELPQRTYKPMAAEAQVCPSSPAFSARTVQSSVREAADASEVAARRYAEQMEVFDLLRRAILFGARHITLLRLVNLPDFYVRQIMGPDYVAVAGRPPKYSDIGTLSRTEQVSLACVMKYYYRLRNQGFSPERSLVSAYGVCQENNEEIASFDLAFHTVCATEGRWGHPGGMMVLRPCRHCQSHFLNMRDLTRSVRCPVCQTRARHNDLSTVPRKNAKVKVNPSSDNAVKALQYAVERYRFIERSKAIGATELQAYSMWYRSQRLDCPSRYRSAGVTARRVQIFTDWFATGSSGADRRPLIGFLVRYEQLLEAGQTEHEAMLTAAEAIHDQGVLERSPKCLMRLLYMIAATRCESGTSGALMLRASCLSCRSTTFVPHEGSAPRCAMCLGFNTKREPSKRTTSARGAARAAKSLADAARARSASPRKATGPAATKTQPTASERAHAAIDDLAQALIQPKALRPRSRRAASRSTTAATVAASLESVAEHALASQPAQTCLALEATELVCG